MLYELVWVLCGEYYFYVVRVRIGDVFGLIEKIVFYELEDILFVYLFFQCFFYQVNERYQEDGVSGFFFVYQYYFVVVVSVWNYQLGDWFVVLDWKIFVWWSQLMMKEFELF